MKKYEKYVMFCVALEEVNVQLDKIEIPRVAALGISFAVLPKGSCQSICICNELLRLW